MILKTSTNGVAIASFFFSAETHIRFTPPSILGTDKPIFVQYRSQTGIFIIAYFQKIYWYHACITLPVTSKGLVVVSLHLY